MLLNLSESAMIFAARQPPQIRLTAPSLRAFHVRQGSPQTRWLSSQTSLATRTPKRSLSVSNVTPQSSITSCSAAAASTCGSSVIVEAIATTSIG